MVAERYRSLVPFKVGFIVRQAVPNSKNYTENSGTFCLGSKERFRVIFPEQEIVWDGDWLWTRDHPNHQVIVEEFNPRSSLKFIGDVLNGSLSDYQIVRTDSQAGNMFIELKPKVENGYIRSMRLKIDNSVKVVRSVSYQDFQNNTISIEFDTLTGLNPADSGLFRIDLKKSEELIDLRP